MKKTLLVLSLAVLLAACNCNNKKEERNPQSFSYSPDYEVLQIDQSRLDRIDALLQDYIDRGIIPHALTFVAKNGQVIHNKAFGWKNVENSIPLEKDNIFRMASQTKAIVSVALMTLFEQGKFQIDDPVSLYIPEMTDQVIDRRAPDGSVISTRKATTPVTIRHLMSHSAGIIGQQGPRDPNTPRPQFDLLEQHVKNLVQYPLMYDPGTNWNYNPASDVMGYLVEYFSGMTLQEYIKKAVLDPLEINDMAYYFDEPYRDRFVTLYREVDGKLVGSDWGTTGRTPFQADRRYAGGGGGLNGTIDGYARFCQMLVNWGEFNGVRILGRRTIEMMGENQLPAPNNGGNGHQFGLGFQVSPKHYEETGRRAIGNFTPMVSPGSLSWGGANNTDYIIDHKEDMIILLYTNRTPDTKIWEKFLNTVYQTLE